MMAVRVGTYEETGICACGKAAMDGVRCHLGATHEPKPIPFWETKPVPFKYPWEK